LKRVPYRLFQRAGLATIRLISNTSFGPTQSTVSFEKKCAEVPLHPSAITRHWHF
jgi:hypothetical protein